MKKLVVVLLGAFLLLAAPVGCGTSSVSSGLGERFTLKVGETVKIASEGLTLKLDKVLNDSRCPDGASCVWAGQVQCLVTVELNGKKEQITLTQLGSTASTTQIYSRYYLDFDVAPYPKLGATISSSDYRLNLKVTKIS